MVIWAKEMRRILTIRVATTISYPRNRRTVTIGQIPRIAKAFFRPLRSHFAEPAWGHFWRPVLAITVSDGCTLDRLAKKLRGSTHRTNHGEFLWRSVWDESAVMQQIALDLLRSLYRKDAGPCYLILDDTQTLKRAKERQCHSAMYLHPNTATTGQPLLSGQGFSSLSRPLK